MLPVIEVWERFAGKSTTSPIPHGIGTPLCYMMQSGGRLGIFSDVGLPYLAGSVDQQILTR